MMLRLFCLLMCVGVFSLNNVCALDDNKENLDVRPPKRKFIGSEVENKRHKGNETPDGSPIKGNFDFQTPERRYWDPLKRKLIERGVDSDFPVESPEVRNIYRENDTGEFFSSPIKFKGKVVFQSDLLFNPTANVLSASGVWKTNLERMQGGLSPVGHKGIFKGICESLSTSKMAKIRKKQRKYRIELQHVTQKDTGLDEDPICEMTHDAHMGEDTRHIIKKNVRTEKFEIIASSLKKEEALRYLESQQDCIMVANVLHFREGSSLINRKKFATWRTAYWEERARGSERRSLKCVRRTLFMQSSPPPVLDENKH